MRPALTPEFAPGLTLGIETSCDETGIGIVEDGRKVRANVVSSQVAAHRPYGGVVPEIASRAHLENFDSVLSEALQRSGADLSDVDVVAVTRGPGLAGALMVGISAAKGLAQGLQRPLVGLDHMEGHVFGVLLGDETFAPPALLLLVSGGHTMLVHMPAWGEYAVVGETLDDAAGEAYDKVARLIGMSFPGGPEIDRASKAGDAAAIPFPRAMLDESLDFSLSGLKTAVVNEIRKAEEAGEKLRAADIAASFQEAVVDVQVAKTIRAARELGVESVALGGGVAANSRLREQMAGAAGDAGLALHLTPPALCTDNGAMIAAAGAFRLLRDGPSSFDLGAEPSLRLADRVRLTG